LTKGERGGFHPSPQRGEGGDEGDLKEIVLHRRV